MKLQIKRNYVLIAAGLVLALLLFAWIDGGEEPIRPVAEPIPLPESVG